MFYSLSAEISQEVQSIIDRLPPSQRAFALKEVNRLKNNSDSKSDDEKSNSSDLKNVEALQKSEDLESEDLMIRMRMTK